MRKKGALFNLRETMMRNYLTTAAVLLFLTISFGQEFNITAGRVYFFYNVADTMNVNSAYNLISLDYHPTWSLHYGAISLLTENGIARDDETAGSGIAYSTRWGGRYTKIVSDRTEISLTAAGSAVLNPEYDNINDSRGIELSGAGEISLGSATYLNCILEYDRLVYSYNPAFSGNIYESSTEISHSFESNRSLHFQINGGYKQYDLSGSSTLLGSRLQIGQALGDAKGLSGYLEGQMIFGKTSTGLLNDALFGAVTDHYTYDKLGTGVRFKALFPNNRFVASYGFEARVFKQASRQDNIHIAGIGWTKYLNNAVGQRRVGLSFEPSVKLTQSTATGEDYLAAYLMVGFER